MGVMYGIVNKDQTDITINAKYNLRELLRKKYPDVFIYEDEDILFGIQHSDVSIQSTLESGPLIFAEDKYIIMAEASIERREELFEELDISKNDRCDISDTRLIALAFIKWGNKLLDHIIGEFAFVIYDRVNKSYLSARDHLGVKKFHYCDNNNYFLFGTTMGVISATMGGKQQLNDLWIANFLALNGPVHDVICDQTIFKEIYQLKPGYFMATANDKKILEKYWKINVFKKKRMTFDDACYGLKKVLEESIKDKILTSGEVGISLSGGLDSTSVAVLANQMLKKDNKKLFTYSSVPYSKYNLKDDSYNINDESDYVKCVTELDENMVARFLDSEGKNSVSEVERHLDFLEHPYKFIENYFWIDNVVANAANDNCKILLNGDYGNNTISYGNFESIILTHLRKHKFISALMLIQDISKNWRYSRIKLAKYSLKDWLNFGRFRKKRMNYRFSPINQEFCKEIKVERLHRKLGINGLRTRSMDAFDQRKFYIDSNILSQINSIKSASYIKYGVQIKDPTMDIRVIEYCFSVPYYHYIYKGKEREVIREAMKDLIPDKVRLNYSKRGYQSADWILRLDDDYDKIKNTLLDAIQHECVRRYVDVSKIKSLLIEGKTFKDMEERNVWMLTVTYIFTTFMLKYEAENLI